jgi:hypothetical protein
MQELVQWALEAEVMELLGRVRYQRRAEVDAFPGYRNGLEEASQAEHAPGDGDVAASPGLKTIGRSSRLQTGGRPVLSSTGKRQVRRASPDTLGSPCVCAEGAAHSLLALFPGV